MSQSRVEVQDYIDDLEEDAEEIGEQARQFFSSLDTEKKRVRASIMSNKKSQKTFWVDPEGALRDTQRDLKRQYESWYTRSENLVAEYLPGRLDEFEEARSEIKEYFDLDKPSAGRGWENAFNGFVDLFDEQRHILNSVPGRIESATLEAWQQISRRVEKEEIQQARELFDEDFVRSSGVVAAVALERHLLTLCENSEEVEEYEPNHGISRLAQTLHEADVIEKTTWNDLKALASIRETCAHAEEPKKPAVRRLINDSEDFIRRNPLH
ncbi:hypothetical protein SAMN05216388_101826 [Halorientalis persicus]|uniref:DUF4145 domain-containing protein n=1 Tax=Halorientalis persicus TaxID=1367881 RepID=A0A1H8S9M1_9EURY|nr:hypothetical protein [Halorientalis persicus]SEO74863.1 hypothetical protein SAMN05216388_101826 [Halorientalis persicus]